MSGQDGGNHHWVAVVFAVPMVLAGAYVVYRLGLTVRAIRADRAGDTDRAGELRMRAVLLGLGFSVALTMAFLVVLVVASL
jgi:hypothetical protein